MKPDPDALAGFLRNPERLATARLADWDRLIPQARQAGLLARLCLMAERDIGLDAVPEKPRDHLIAARIIADKHRRDVQYEIDRLTEALGQLLQGRIILLKGAAYLCAGLPPSAGRVFSDIDILVPRRALAGVEAILGLGGWRLGDMDPYDERYYRRWMHQLPPLVHAARHAALDVHHTIVPATSRIALDADELLDATVPIADRPGLAVLSPADMVLHSAVHLFNEGEYARGLRDLDDLNLLLRHFSSPPFWLALLARAVQLDLARPLYYAVRHAARLLGTPVPPGFVDELALYRPSAPGLWVMDGLFGRALRPPHPACREALTGAALWLLYVRAHYLRMPLHLLVPHLARKAFRRRVQSPEFA